ncbi:Cysteine-rich secretory protein-related protein [Dioscorea alata]|uniref:Cysteine-rich secretory protein-related protein n=1 Tax=Dioscorea alata TaxID=55571 RepID=A0ACB7VHW4_DIOAL|nr:Cysteine-rich secretory protein-related protein [Dioscorea alata]
MTILKFAFILASIMAIAMTNKTLAQNSQKDYLDGHNSARKAVRLGPVTWDDNVAAYAQNYANRRIGDCRLIHSHGPYGENIFWGSWTGYTVRDAVNSWASEKKYYNYTSNTCQPGRVCGHYTQIVWRDSNKIGCARVNCNNGGVFIICNYKPAGNVRGRRPY